MTSSWAEFLKRPGKRYVTDEQKYGIKQILSLVVAEAIPGCTLGAVQTCSEVEVDDKTMDDVMDRLHQAFFDLADRRKRRPRAVGDD